MLNTIYTAFMQFLFPSHCPSCNAYVEQEGQWCKSCLRKIMRNKNLAYDNDVRQYISPVFAMSKYDEGMRHLIHQLKFQRKLSALAYINTVVNASDLIWYASMYDLIIPVPLHPSKLKQRGFNQVDKIFAPWAKEHNFTYADILERSKQTKSQYSLNKNERHQNLASAFRLKAQSKIELNNRKCLLVDDIFTSGTTLKNCAQVLLNNGATTVSGLVLASQADD